MNEPVLSPDTLFLLNDFIPPIAYLGHVGGDQGRFRHGDGLPLVATSRSYRFSGSVALYAPPPDSTFTTMTWPLDDVLRRYLGREAGLRSPQFGEELKTAMSQETDTTLTVNGALYEGRSVAWGDVRVHAARVDTGWTVVALVPADTKPVVMLDYTASAPSA